MLAQAYEGYFRNGEFYTAEQTIKIPEGKKVFITIIDEFITDIENREESQGMKDKDTRVKWIEKMNTAIRLSLNENLPDMTRSIVMREPIGLSD